VDESVGWIFTHAPAVAVQDDGLTQVVYFRQKGSETELMHAVGAANSWARTVLDDGFAGFGETRFELTIVNNDQPLFCYFSEKTNGAHGLFLARQQGGLWEFEEVDADGQQACELEIDSQGAAVVLYGTNEGGLRVARASEAGWQIKDLLSSTGPLGIRWPSMALDKDDNLHAAYWDADQQAVFYLHDTQPFVGIP
jgi:hypothetical protein